MSRRLPRSLLQKFSPFERLSINQLNTVQQYCKTVTVAAGHIVLRPRDTTQHQCFLVSGAIEVRLSFEQRTSFHQGSPECRRPLNHLLADHGFIRAQSNCKILMVESGVIDNLVVPGHPEAYGIADLSDQRRAEPADWTEAFLRSSLSRALAPRAAVELLRELEEVEVCRTQRVVTPQTGGDYFYILKQGRARVIFDIFGPQRGEFIDLRPGDYFGDESLVSQAQQNATVVMKTHGMLMRLGREQFDRLIRPALVNSIDTQKVSTLMDSGAKQIQKMDVRFSVETRSNRQRDRIDVPITHLRKRLKELQPRLTYIVGPENDCRSALGAYMLRRAGFDAYHLVSENKLTANS
ncbi:cyclic nucleotide-binding domain-containing protein [Exilibacterium tricleocarpae]|uniref:Cyclic nucleotide-binding domain-containing protein n=1 Tax=Exilibacterium tricleocarpae TaxID=2591008 RepID=A0A545SY34_9GAMM|nr:cyclic nucleotide-binding domain-containing protein [Exilibacterium tricleocarpae]TQV69874.1 cyclic nucleotide-binding domain-containing protein [Exilibacterium tricleocarpae]